MASTTEIFRVVGKIVLEGMDELNKAFDAAGKKASTFSDTLEKNSKGLGKNLPKDIMQPVDDSLDKTVKKMNNMEKETGGFQSFVKSGFGIGLGMKVIDGAMGIFDKVGGTLKDAVFGMNSTLETSQLQFETLMGSADDAKKQVAFLFEFAKKTPFETEPIIQASKLLQTFGGNALNTEKNLNLIGDAAAATNAPIDELGMWTGRLYAALQAGKPFGDAASRLGELAVLTPKARQQLEDMQKEGKSGDEIFAAYQQSLTRFTGAMEKQAGTWQGLTGTFSDTVNIVLAKAGKPFFELAGKGLAQVNDLLGSDAFSAGAEKFATTISAGLDQGISAITGFISVAMPKVQQIFGIAKDGVTTFIQALQGNWVDAPGIVGLHELIGNIGIVIREKVIPAVLNFKDFLIGTVIPAIISFKDNLVNGFELVWPAVQSFVQNALTQLTQFGAWFSGEVAQRIVTYIQDIANTFMTVLLPAIITVVQAALPVLQDFGNWFISDGLPKIQEFIAALIQGWDQIEPKIIAAVTALYAAIVPGLVAILDFVHAHSDAIQYWFNLAWNMVSGTIGGALQIISSAIQLTLDLIAGNWKGAWDDITGILQGAINIILGIISPAVTIIHDLFQSLLDFLTPTFDAMSNVAISAWTLITTTITTAMDAISTTITTVMGIIQPLWAAAWDAIQLVADTVWRAIETIVQVEMALVQAIMEPILTAIQSIWETTWNAVQGVLQTVWDFMNQNIITPIFTAIHDFIQSTLNTIQDIWTTAWNAIQSTVQTIWDAISSFLTDGWNTLKATADTVWASIKDSITQPIQDAQSSLETIWNDIQQKASDVWAAIQKVFDDAKEPIKDALFWPFEQMRDGVEAIMRAAGNNLLSPLQSALDKFGDFVNGIKGAINWVSNKLSLGDIIGDTWQGARIGQLAKGTESWLGGPSLIAEEGIEAAKLPDGTLKLFTKPQIANLPQGTKVWSANKTKELMTNVDGSMQMLGYSMSKHTIGRGGVWDKVGQLTGGAVDFARDLIGQGAEKVISPLVDKLGIPSFPGVMSNFGGKIASIMKEMLVKSVSELSNIVKDKLPVETSTDGGTPGPAGTINGVSGDHILEIARTVHGVRNWCEKFVGDVFSQAGARYARASDAYEHSLMQGTTPGTGPTGAPVYTGFNHPGDVAISMGNGMVFGTEGNGPNGAGPFSPYAGARYTLNPAANGMVVDRPTAILAGENIRAVPELITPVALMKKTFREELGNANSGMTVNIYVTANTAAEGTTAGNAAYKAFRDRMIAGGFNT